MHSVVVIGDIRTHYSKINKELWTDGPSRDLEERIPEGAYFMQQAIDTALEKPLTRELKKRLKQALKQQAKANAALQAALQFHQTTQANANAFQLNITSALAAAGLSPVAQQLIEDSRTEKQPKLAEQVHRSSQRLGQCEIAFERAKLAVGRLQESLTTSLKVFGLTGLAADSNPYVPEGWIHHWSMKLVELPETEDRIARQERVDKSPPLPPQSPWLSQRLFNALQPQKYFSPGGAAQPDPNGELEQGFFEAANDANIYQVPECPDVVVFEDRDGVIRNLRIDDEQGVWSEDENHQLIRQIYEAIPGATDAELETLINSWTSRATIPLKLTHEDINKQKRAYKKDWGIAPTDAAIRRENCHRLVLIWAINNLLKRMEIPAVKSEVRHRPTMEPVIFCSIMGNAHAAIHGGSTDFSSALDAKPANLYDRLLKHDWLRERTIIVLDASELRSGAQPLAISSALSWERTVQETIAELKRSPAHSNLLQFGQVIVRFGVTGALHIVQRSGGTYSYTLHFDALHDDATWSDEMLKTTAFGRAGIFIASLIQSLTLTCNERHGHPFIQELSRGVSNGLGSAIGRCRELAHNTFGMKHEEFRILKKRHWIPKDLFQVKPPVDPRVFRKKKMRDSNDGEDDNASALIANADVPPVILRNWSLLAQNAQSKLGKLASEIVRLGPEVILSGGMEINAIAAPVMRYGTKESPSAFVVDRREVEGYRSIEKAIRSHVERVSDAAKLRFEASGDKKQSVESPKPLSIAVFGPPGSGKSTAVKRIIEKVSEDSSSQKLVQLAPFNLSQYSNVEELKQAFVKVGKTTNGLPIAFFDEFDSNFPGDANKKLGWLKYFLAPMEDGIFQDVELGSAILVFAGGTVDTFADFSLEGRSRSDTQWLEFGQAKGPDFVSRLRGHLNIIGVNPADPEDELFLIRRAIVVHSILKKLQKLKVREKAKIDSAMVRAVLHVPEYRHGSRSLRMLLESCLDGDRISVGAVPPMHQLNMLVDGKAFTALLTNLSAS